MPFIKITFFSFLNDLFMKVKLTRLTKISEHTDCNLCHFQKLILLKKGISKKSLRTNSDPFSFSIRFTSAVYLKRPLKNIKTR